MNIKELKENIEKNKALSNILIFKCSSKNDSFIFHQYINKYSSTFLETPEKYVADLSLPGFVLAGFLVGFGAKMANGCTSGHGICGVPRLSKRSLVAITLFLIFGTLMSTIRYYHPFLLPENQPYSVWDWSLII